MKNLCRKNREIRSLTLRRSIPMHVAQLRNWPMSTSSQKEGGDLPLVASSKTTSYCREATTLVLTGTERR
jgi:hypothetical protein